MAKEKVSLKNVNLAKIVSLRTDLVKVIHSDIEAENGTLGQVILKIAVNPFRISESSWDFSRKCSHYRIRYSPITGRISCSTPDAIEFPVGPRLKAEFAAIEEFCILLREHLGLDTAPAPEDEVPPDELAVALKQIKEMTAGAEEMKNTIKKMTERLAQASQRMAELGKDLE